MRRPEDFGIGQLFWAIREAVVIADAVFERIELWNPVAEEIFGYRPQEIVGKPLEVLIPDRLRARHHAGLSRYRATGQGPYINRRSVLELPALHKAGRELTIEMTLCPVSESALAGLHVLAVIREVSERKRLEAALLASEAERRHALEARLEGVILTAREMAHVLNNDLGLALGTLDLLRSRADLPPSIAASIAEAADRLEEAGRHIRRLQQVVRVETKDTPIGPALDLDRSIGLDVGGTPPLEPGTPS